MSRADGIGRALGLDVDGSRARYAASRVRYRRAIVAALDRLCQLEDQDPLTRAPVPVPYAAAGLAYPFERREVDGRDETESEAPAGDPGPIGAVAGRVGDPGSAGAGRRAIPVPMRVPQGA